MRIGRAHSRGRRTGRGRWCTLNGIRHTPSRFVGSMEAVYPAAASALARGRRARRAGVRARHRTMPVTFAEIKVSHQEPFFEHLSRRNSSKEVDEENEEDACATAPQSRGSSSGERRRPDVLDERLGRQFVEFRRRRKRDALPEPPDEPTEHAAAAPCAGPEPSEPAGAPPPAPRAGSEPAEPR